MENRRDRMESKPADLIVQGDVFLFQGKVPEGAKLLPHRRLAEGEATGHAHVADCGELYEAEGVLYLKTLEETTIQHEEHKPIVIPANSEMQIGIIREWDEFEAEARNVRD